jgi:hypothetical protein
MKIPLGFSIVVCGFMVAVVWQSAHSGKHDLLDIATFVILTLTLIALVVYAWDTNSIAQVTRAHWKRQSVLDTTYEMNIADKKGDSGRTTFRINNPSRLMVIGVYTFLIGGLYG